MITKDSTNLAEVVHLPADAKVNYFAIASMINVKGLHSRKLYPTSTSPAIIKDFKLVFYGKSGMADSEEVVGESFHGAVHVLTYGELLRLD